MADYEVGYGKPPKHSRFKPGNKANPNGRPRRKPAAIAELIDRVFESSAEYRERGKTKRAPRRDLTIKTHVRLALNGNLKSIEALLLLRMHAQTSPDAGAQRLEITEWMPDYPGQTGEQKTREFAAQGGAEPAAWWMQANANPEGNDK